MKEELLELAKSEKSPIAARNLAREYLQAHILQSLQRAGAMTMLAFHGGTALRFLFGLLTKFAKIKELGNTWMRDQPKSLPTVPFWSLPELCRL